MVSNLIEKTIFIVFCGLIIVHCNVVRNEDICGQHNGRRLYLELGEQGILYAKNISFIKNSPRQQQGGSQVYVTNSSHDRCSLELVTCPSCAITVTFKSLALPHSCGDVGMMMDSPCRCDYVWISEPPYEDISGAPYCGLYYPIIYKSSTRTVSITLLFSQSHKHAFTIEYTSERNRLHLNGSDSVRTKGVNGTVGGILTSPFFPARYPRDLGIEYIITCPTETIPCRIRVLFSDFQLSTVSIIEFYDWNGQRLDVSSGARFRPTIILSSGPSLLIRFYANGGTGLGYKAFYSYVIGQLYDKSIQPITDCGGYVENLGGAITMMDMVGQGTKTYDCVWLIRPPKTFLDTKTHIYLKVITFAEMAGNTELIIREGPTSALLALEVLRHPASQVQPPRMREHIAPASNGFHVSLRGTFGSTSRVAIAYTAFGYTDCFSGSDFLCQNHRCIPSQLNCDGFDHCGDNSDEPTSCLRNWEMELPDRRWHMNKANYYFPKLDRYPDLKTATLVFVASSVGLIFVISALIVLLYRVGARARQQRELQSRLQTISELLDGARIDEISVSDDPPVYEAPPGYDEVVKVELEHEGCKRKKPKNLRLETTNRSSSSQQTPDLTPSSNIPILIGTNARGNQERPAMSTSTAHNVPETPPPPYVTPPGTSPRNFDLSSLSRHRTINISVPKSSRSNRVRRTCHRQNSFPGPDVSSIVHPSTSVDPETLGVYLNQSTSSTSPSAEKYNSQLANSSNAAPNTSRGFEEGLKSHEQQGNGTSIHQTAVCLCKGACGCASHSETPGSPQEDSTKCKILRLLGTSKSSSPNFSSITIPTIQQSRPVSSLSEKIYDVRKSSIYYRGSYLTQFSLVSPSCTPDELQIISQNTSILGNSNPSTLSNTPVLTPNISIDSPVIRSHRRQDLRCVSCDLESLYESIQALDNFLARRGVNDGPSMRQSVTVMLFGTPEHSGRRFEGSDQNGFFNFVRKWRSSDDTY